MFDSCVGQFLHLFVASLRFSVTKGCMVLELFVSQFCAFGRSDRTVESRQWFTASGKMCKRHF